MDVVAGLRLRLLLAAADGAVVSPVETLALAFLAAAQLFAADVPLAERRFALGPLGPAGPHPVHCTQTHVRTLLWSRRPPPRPRTWTVDVGVAERGAPLISGTRPSAVHGGGTVAFPAGHLKPHPAGDGTGGEGRPRAPASVH